MDIRSKLLTDAKFYIALAEDSAINIKKTSIIECIRNGADVNVKFTVDANNTPLHIAVMRGDQETVNLLLKHGAMANIRNDAGKTAFDLATDLSDRSAVAKILETSIEGTGKELDTITPAGVETVTENSVYPYKKRVGTAGIRGQLYESKLLTLVYLRALRCQQMTEFLLGTNVTEIGDMDDLCMRFKITNADCVIFFQAKHKQEVDKGRLELQDLWRKSSDFSLLKYFSSYRKIRENFQISSDDILFCGKYEDIKPYYVLYTTLKDDMEYFRKGVDTENVVANLLGTGNENNIFQIAYEEQHIDTLTNVLMDEYIKNLGKKLFKLIQDGKCDTMLCDADIRSYHVVLARKVLNITEINSGGRRKGTFREEFFTSNEEKLIILREALYAEAIKNNKLSDRDIEVSLLRISFQPQAETISELIGNVLMYDSNTNTLKLTKEAAYRKLNFKYVLESLQLPQCVISEAFEIAGWRKLKSLTFDVPATFGNIDMTINKKKMVKRLQYLSEKICDVIMETADIEGNVVIRKGMYAPDKHLEAGVLAINGGIAGAVGNLFVADTKNTLKFNLKVEELGEIAKQFYVLLKDRLENLEKYRFIIEIVDFPRLSFQPTVYEKRLARDFLDNLYFYTHQAKEEQLEDIVTKELQTHNCGGVLSKSESRIKANALFLKLHNEIQSWWMIEETAYYLTRKMPIFEKIFLDFRNNGLLAFLSFTYLKEMDNSALEFKTEAMTDVLSAFSSDMNNVKLIVIYTNVLVLTCHKLKQYLKGTDNCIFIDIDYICKMSSQYLEMITAELSATEISTVIIFANNMSKYNIKDILGFRNIKKIILVTSNYDPTEKCLCLRDERINLNDLTDESQNKVLQTHFVYQGIEITFAEVFDSSIKHLINSEILHKIINNESIKVGQTLELSNYKEIKHYYVPRTLQLNEKYDGLEENMDNLSSHSSDENLSSESPKKFSPTTLIDHHRVFKTKQHKRTYDIILILDAPGMGKSTLLTYLSLETKKRYPGIWIQRINLIDHTRQFNEWHENKVKVDSLEALKFLCKVLLTKQSCMNDLNIELEIVNDEIKLVNCKEVDSLTAFEFNIFLHCFKERRIIFLLDGFDEICPHYKLEVIELLRYLTRRCAVHELTSDEQEQDSHVQCVWITSRPYNDIRKTLETEFGESYTLKPFYFTEIRLFLDKYMRRNLNLNELTSQQLININAFFEYMKRFDLYDDATVKDVRLVNIPLHSIYVAAMEYFKNEIKRSHVTEDNLEYVQDWDIVVNKLSAWRKYLNDFEGLRRAITLSGVPLHVYIAIHYFQDQIKNTTLTDPDELIKLWDLDTNAFAFYERFIEMKLKTIRFEEKNQMDLYKPDVKMTYEKEKKEFLNNHQKIAFYTVCSKTVFTDEEIEEIKCIIKGMEIAEDKTGFVDRIVEDEPRFVHYTFAEYFAVEYITDLLKSGEHQKQKVMIDYILKNMVYHGSDGILNIFDLKFKFDAEFAAAMSTPQLRSNIFEMLMMQNERQYPDMYDEDIGEVPTALDMAARYGLQYFTDFLIDTLVTTVVETNFTTLVNFIKEGTFFNRFVVSWNDELVGKILDCFRRFDASKIDDLFPYSLFDKLEHAHSTNEEFIEAYHHKLLVEHYLRLRRNRHMSH